MFDVTKLLESSSNNAFKNNNVYTYTFTLSGSTSAGLNTETFTATLPTSPDMVDILFNGPTDTVYGTDPRPSAGWFRQGYVWVVTNNAGGGNPSRWRVQATISGTTLTIIAQYVQQFTTSETLTSTNFSCRVIDFSIF